MVLESQNPAQDIDFLIPQFGDHPIRAWGFETRPQIDPHVMVLTAVTFCEINFPRVRPKSSLWCWWGPWACYQSNAMRFNSFTWLAEPNALKELMSDVCQFVFQLPNHLFEELAMDAYDEVDRRETDASKPRAENSSSINLMIFRTLLWRRMKFGEWFFVLFCSLAVDAKPKLINIWQAVRSFSSGESGIFGD